ncbi:PQQ-binding-like beta-propeller repeat protein [Actinoplanes sp. NPDC023714]|uniref:outer membrane protein assembly factor BamB family protein n=1 Tax=Actinoplanes sp. NPDC023714 TaxID=3154322 RepID=UPI0033F0B1C0
MAAPGENDITKRTEATEVSTPDTDTHVGEGPEYSEPVDPWATGEAAALAAGGQLPYREPPGGDPTWTIPGAAGPHPTAEEPVGRTYKKGLLIGIVAGVVALGVAAAVALWPGVRALDFHPVQEVARFDPAVPVGFSWSDAEVIGDRAYFASSDPDGRLGVVAVDTGSREVAWSNAAAGTATLWDRMIALPVGLVIFSSLEAGTGRAQMRILGAGDGRELWNRPIGSSDTVHFGADTMVLVDRVEQRLLGLDLASGKVRWEEEDPDSTTVVTVTTEADLAGPAGTAGRPFSPNVSDDDRFVQINSDRSASVRDIRTGEVSQTRPSVASTSDETVAHDGRLFVQESGNAQRIFAYDLEGLGEPVTLHTAPPQASLSDLTPCGEKRLCFVETAGSDQVIAVDAVKGGEVWRRDVPDVESLIPVGESLLVVTDKESTLIDVGGDPLWTVPGVAVRLDAGNVLRFSESLTTSVGSRSLSGVHLGDEAAEMGLLRDVRPGACAWNTTVLACVRETDFALFSFA